MSEFGPMTEPFTLEDLDVKIVDMEKAFRQSVRSAAIQREKGDHNSAARYITLAGHGASILSEFRAQRLTIIAQQRLEQSVEGMR